MCTGRRVETTAGTRKHGGRREPFGRSPVESHVMASARAQADGARGELDELTLARAQRGDDGALAVFIQQYERRVFALISRMVGARRDLVEDLAQDTFLRALAALPRFKPSPAARLSTWLLTIATRVTLDELRRVRHTKGAPIELADDVPSPERADTSMERNRLGRDLAQAVAALPDDQRATWLMRDVHELSYEDIAKALNIDLGTVKSRIARSRAPTTRSASSPRRSIR